MPSRRPTPAPSITPAPPALSAPAQLETYVPEQTGLLVLREELDCMLANVGDEDARPPPIPSATASAA